jgi:hypothetical protein
MLNDYVSMIEGSVPGSVVEQTDTEDRSAGGGAKLYGIGGEIKKGSSSEKKHTLTSTDASLFERLYSQLKKREMLKEVAGNIENFEKGEIIEAEAQLIVSAFAQLIEAVNAYSGFFSMIPNMDSNALLGISSLAKSESADVAFRVEQESSTTILATLTKKYLLEDINTIDGEISVLGKIKKVVPKGQKIQSMGPFSSLVSALQKLDRNKASEFTQQLKSQNLFEEIEGPALTILPLAIWR